jgi:glycosyltransferase involved in cell wall biosynthesis
VASILYVVHRFWPYQGGSERYFFEIAKRTAADGHRVTVATTDAWDAAHLHFRKMKRIESLHEDVDGVTIRRFRVRHFVGQHRILPRLARLMPTEHPVFDRPHLLVPGLSWWLRHTSEKFDLVHAGVFPHAPLMAAAAAYCRTHGVPYVAQPMLNAGEPYRALENEQFLSPKLLSLLDPAAAILTNTSYENELLVEKGVPADKISVASPAVNAAEVMGGDGAAFRAKHGISGRILLQISTQTHDKGSWHTVEAFRQLQEAGRPVTLVLIGSLETDFRKFFDLQPESVRKGVRLLDYVSEQEKKDALAACDVFVMPSRADSFGIAYLEASLYQKPVIGCYAGGVPRVIQEGVDGCLIPFGDVDMLASYVAMLLDDPAKAAAMGARGREKVLARYQWESTQAVVRDVYHRCLSVERPSLGRGRLRIGIDISRSIGEATGVGIYASSLVDALAEIDPVNDYVLYPYFWECFPPEFRNAHAPARPNFSLRTENASLAKIQQRWMSQRPDAAAGNVDIVHSTGYTSPKLDKSRLVVSIHDLSFVTHPEFHTDANRQFCLAQVEQAARHAATIIVPSRNTKRDLQKYYKVADDRIAVIPYAADPAFAPVDVSAVTRSLSKFRITGDYLLFVGSVEPRKNLAGLVRAADAWLRANAGRQIIVAGPAGWLNSDVHKAIEARGLGDRVRFLGYVDRDDLRALYTGARAFVYPSFYEGFGFPVLEAMACGCPVITSNTPAVEEIAAGAGKLVTAGDDAELARVISEVADDELVRAELRKLGLERAAKYTWRETARATLEVYRALFPDDAL